MDAIVIAKQKAIGEELDKKLLNYKKDPQPRRTKAKSEERIEKINEKWSEFVNNDKKVQEYATAEHTSYHTNKYYDLVKKIYDEIMEILLSRTNAENANQLEGHQARTNNQPKIDNRTQH